MTKINTIEDIGPQALIRSRFGIAGVTDPSPSVAPEIMPVFTVEGPKPEHEYLLGIKRCSASFGALAGTPGESMHLLIWNPPASNLLVVVDSFVIVPAAAVAIDFTVGEQLVNPGELAATRNVTDGRWRGPTGMAITQIGNAPAAFGTRSVFRGIVTAAVDRVHSPVGWSCVVAPGQIFDVGFLTANIGNTQSWVGYYERPAQYGELS